MNKLGLTKGRYKQMLEYYENDKKAVKEVVEEWGADKCNKGYDILILMELACWKFVELMQSWLLMMILL